MKVVTKTKMKMKTKTVAISCAFSFLFCAAQAHAVLCLDTHRDNELYATVISDAFIINNANYSFGTQVNLRGIAIQHCKEAAQNTCTEVTEEIIEHYDKGEWQRVPVKRFRNAKTRVSYRSLERCQALAAEDAVREYKASVIGQIDKVKHPQKPLFNPNSPLRNK